LSPSKLPDPSIKLDKETGHYSYADPDWSEFFNVIKGNGPGNVDRLRARTEAWEDGAWVRDGLMAHARKKSTRVAAE